MRESAEIPFFSGSASRQPIPLKVKEDRGELYLPKGLVGQVCLLRPMSQAKVSCAGSWWVESGSG